jgi:protein-S-isoprenylcysteine O-methyltransferase Ste14
MPDSLQKLFRAVIFILATGLLYLGVVLLGWGLDDLGGYFSNPPRLGYAAVVGLFSLAVGVQAYGSTEGIRGRKGEQGKLVFRQRIVRILLVLALYVSLFFIPFFDRRNIGVMPVNDPVRWMGVLFSASGFTLVFCSGLALGRQYSGDVTIQEGHRLVTAGVYRFLRHPRYLGVIALSIGISLTFRSWIGLLASVIFIAVLLFRIRDEEVILHNEFGPEWEVYWQRSWRLVPFIF